MSDPKESDLDDPLRFLPLPPMTFHILMALADQDRHGYAILQEVTERTNGKVRLGAGTLYRTIHRLKEQGLVAEALDRPSPELDDERRRYYRLTPLGTRVARAETERLGQMVDLAKSLGFARGTV
ncbi:MAG: PadR family transcriptional regulator [Acidobacteriota bacterium]